MEFAEWVVSGLEQYRLGRLPAGDAFFQTVWSRFGSDPRLTAFLNTGDPGARQALTGLIAHTVRQDPGFEHQLRAAAPGGSGVAPGAPASPAGPAETMTALPVYGTPGFGQGFGPGLGQPGYPAAGDGAPAPKRSFFKTTGGVVTAVVLVLALAGGVVAVAMSAGGGDKLSDALKGTWHCSTALPGETDKATGDLTIGDGTWSVGDQHGTWRQSGGTVTVTSEGEDSVVTASIPGSTGTIDTTLHDSGPGAKTEKLTGTTSKTALNLKLSLPADGASDSPAMSVTIACTR